MSVYLEQVERLQSIFFLYDTTASRLPVGLIILCETVIFYCSAHSMPETYYETDLREMKKQIWI